MYRYKQIICSAVSREWATDVSICLPEKYPSPEDCDIDLRSDKQQGVFPGSAKKKGGEREEREAGLVVGCRKHIHLFKGSLAGTHLFVMENKASEGVIEWPAVSDPVQGLHRIETGRTKPGLRWEARENL